MDLASNAGLFADWHVVADLENLRQSGSHETRLFGEHLAISRPGDGFPAVVLAGGKTVAAQEKYGFVWASLGEPAADIIDIPEAEEGDRHIVTGGSIAVHASGLRVVENFLDMGHFPFVHAGWLGTEPHTEVPAYEVAFAGDDQILATDCRFFQPVASPTAESGFMVDYVYRVFRPYSVALYKSNPTQPDRKDFIALFVQPVDEERCVAHPFLCYLMDGIDCATVRWFMQLIFAQDKPILENQLPKKLPLDPRTETPVRADAVSVSYRRWLRDRRVSYGAVPQAV